MTHERQYRGLTIQIEGYWSEASNSNLYRWRVVNVHQVVPLEGKSPYREFVDAYNDACRAIDKWLQPNIGSKLLIGWLLIALVGQLAPSVREVYVSDLFSAATLTALAISASVTAGTYALQYLLTKNQKVPPIDRGKNDDIRLSVPGYGEPIVRGWGTFRNAPVWFWHTPIVHSTVTTPGQSGGKASPKPPTPATVDHVYTTSVAGVICEGPIVSVKRIWFDNDLVYNTSVELSASKYEGESGTLAGGASSTSCSACSGGSKATSLGNGGTVTLTVTVPSTGSYEVGVFYTSTEQRTFKWGVNGGATTDLVCASSGGNNIVAIQTFTTTLNSGSNTIKFENAGAACPDLDKIEVAPALIFDPADPVDRRRFTGVIDPNIIMPTDQDISWPFFMHRPTVASSTLSTTLAKYGQPSIRIYTGTETQTADSAIIADKGVANAPAYRGVAYLVIEGLQVQFGRLPNVTVEVEQGTTAANTIVQEIYDLVGVASANLTLTALIGGILTGFVIPSRTQALGKIHELQMRFQFDLPEVDGKVLAVKRNGTSDLTIPYSELRAHTAGTEIPPFDAQITDIDPLLLPGRVDVNYLDPKLDYHNNTQSDMRLTGPQTDQQSISLSIVDSADNMKKLAATLLYQPDMEGRGFRFTTGPKYMRVFPGSVVTLTLPNATHVVRITEAKYQLPAGVCEFEGVRQQASVYSPTATGSVGTGAESPIVPVPGNTKGVIIDGPLLRPEDAGDGTEPVVYVVMCGRGAGGWDGGFFYEEFPINSGNYQLVTAASVPGHIGVTAGTLASVTDPSVWDRTNSLVVKFFSNTILANATEQDLLANPALNLLAIANPSTNAVEYIQFATAAAGVASAPYITQYTISTLLRGRVATDANVGTHTSADDVVLIDTAVKPRRMPLADIGRERKFKFVTSGQAVEDAAKVLQTLRGNSLKPLAPANVRGTRNAAGDLLIQWDRRTRIAAGLRPGSDVPLAEEKEVYLVEFYDGSTLKSWRVVDEYVSSPVMWQTAHKSDASTLSTTASGSVSYTQSTIGSSVHLQSLQTFLMEGLRLEFTMATDNSPGISYVGFGPVVGPAVLGVTVNSHQISFYENWFMTYAGSQNTADTSIGSWPASNVYPGDRLLLEIRNGSAFYYINHTGASTPPVAVNRLNTITQDPVRIEVAGFGFEANKTARIDNCRVLLRGTVYSVADQTVDFGSVQSSLKVRIYQISAVVGPGPYTEATL